MPKVRQILCWARHKRIANIDLTLNPRKMLLEFYSWMRRIRAQKRGSTSRNASMFSVRDTIYNGLFSSWLMSLATSTQIRKAVNAIRDPLRFKEKWTTQVVAIILKNRGAGIVCIHKTHHRCMLIKRRSFIRACGSLEILATLIR